MNIQDQHRFGTLKLTAQNYHMWSHKTQLILSKEKLWRTVRDPPPTDRTSKWLEQDEMASAVIGLLVDDKFLVDVRGQPDAYTTWKYLEKLYGQKNIQTRMSLNRALFSSKFQSGQEMSEHLVSIMNIASRLQDMGYPVDETLLCTAILCSLPEDYAALITAIETNSNSPMTTDYVRSRVMEEADRRRLQHSDRPKAVQALYTTDKSRAYYNPGKGECYYCHKTGHLKRDCRLRRKHEAHKGLQDSSKYWSDRPPQFPAGDHSKTVCCSKSHHPDDPQRITPHEETHFLNTQEPRTMTVKPLSFQSLSSWIIDTGACEHLCKDKTSLCNYQNRDDCPTFVTADGHSSKAEGVGQYLMPLLDNKDQWTYLTLDPVYHLPTITDNLLSVRSLDREGFISGFSNGKAHIQKNNISYFLGESSNGLYRTMSGSGGSSGSCVHLWHEKLGHPNSTDTSRTVKSMDSKAISALSCHPDTRCKTCILAKLANAPFENRVMPNSENVFEMLHSDLCGPVSPTSLGGNSYLLTLIDDYSKHCTVHLIKHKHEAAGIIKDYIETNSSKFHRTPRAYRTDGGGEFCGHELEQYLKSKGIKHQTTVPNTPQQNGLAERHNRTLFDSTRAILKGNKLPKCLWGEVINSANYLNNILIRKDHEKTPFEIWSGRKPSYAHLHVIGTKCIYLNNSPTRKKLDDRGIEGILIGYGDSTHIYRIWDPNRRKVILSRRVVFMDHPCPHCATSLPDQEFTLSDLEENPHTESTSDKSTPLLVIPRRSTRMNKGSAPEHLTYDADGKQNAQRSDWFVQHDLSSKDDISSYGGVLQVTDID